MNLKEVKKLVGNASRVYLCVIEDDSANDGTYYVDLKHDGEFYLLIDGLSEKEAVTYAKRMTTNLVKNYGSSIVEPYRKITI